MTTIQTSSYPVRYDAWNHPRTWVEWTDKDLKSSTGYEAAVYTDMRLCAKYDLPCGIYVEIRYRGHSNGGKHWYMEGQTSDTTINRRQFNRGLSFPTYEAALFSGRVYVTDAEVFMSAADPDWRNRPQYR